MHGQQEICYSISPSLCPRKLPFSITILILIRRQVVVEDDRLDKNGRRRRGGDAAMEGGNDEPGGQARPPSNGPDIILTKDNGMSVSEIVCLSVLIIVMSRISA